MTTRMGNGHYPLVPASEYLDLLERYRDIPNIARMPQTTQGAKAEEQKQSFWKTLISVKTLINVWMPTVMTVGGTIIGAVIGAKYSAPQEQPRQKPKQAIEKHYGHQNIGTNQTTYVYAYPKDTNVQFAVVGEKSATPQAYWITTNEKGLKEVSMATQTEQVVLIKE